MEIQDTIAATRLEHREEGERDNCHVLVMVQPDGVTAQACYHHPDPICIAFPANAIETTVALRHCDRAIKALERTKKKLIQRRANLMLDD